MTTTEKIKGARVNIRTRTGTIHQSPYMEIADKREADDILVAYLDDIEENEFITTSTTEGEAAIRSSQIESVTIGLFYG